MAKLSVKNKELIIFDLDGTLIDSAPDLTTSINYMLKKLGKETFLEKEVRNWLGDGAQMLVKRALQQDNNEKTFKNALEIFLNHYEKNFCINTKLYPNVLQTLQKLKDKGYILAIVTNKPYKFVNPILDKLNILEYFSCVLGGDSLPTKKPAPEPLLEVCKHFGISTDKALMIGDSKNDIISAKDAGIESIALTYGYNFDEDISKYNPNKIIDNISKILD